MQDDEKREKRRGKRLAKRADKRGLREALAARQANGVSSNGPQSGDCAENQPVSKPNGASVPAPGVEQSSDQHAQTGAANGAADMAGDAANKAGEMTGDAVDKAGEMAGDVSDKAGEMAGDIADKTGELIDSASSKGGAAVETVVAGAEDGANKLKEAVSN